MLNYYEGTISSNNLFPRPLQAEAVVLSTRTMRAQRGRTCTLPSFEHSLDSLIQQTFIKRLCVPGPRDRELYGAYLGPALKQLTV